MTELNIKDYIRNELPFEIQSVALNFISSLEESGITFYKDNSVFIIKYSDLD